MFDVVLVRPLALVTEIGIEKCRCFADAATIGQDEGIQILSIALSDWQSVAIISKLKIE